MERSNQPPKPECCRREGQGASAQQGAGPERPAGSVHREIRGPQAGVAPGLSNSASKPINADGDKVLLLQPNIAGAVDGEAQANLPGSQSVAREAKTLRNLGGPEGSRRTNCEGQAGRLNQRQGGGAEAVSGVGSQHSSLRQGRDNGPDWSEGSDRSTQLAQATGPVRTTGQGWKTFLQAIANKAQQDRHHRFGDLYRHLNQEGLRASFHLLRKDAASGVDGETYQAYEKDLEAHLDDLVERLKNKSYRAQMVRRVYIPKDNGKLRPLGILALEDKLVQCAVTQILMAIYEADFLPCSYGYRPGRGPHDAVRELTDELQWGKHNFLVEADIKGFFDHVRHDQLMEMLGRRIHDGALLRLIRKWLKAGILEVDGRVLHPELGTPQGGLVSPVLANVYLHYVLDLWFEEQVRPGNRGRRRLFRFADDFVVCFEYRHEAAAFEQALPKRLAEYGLEVAPDKTKMLRFGRNGGPYNGRFDFLGFEFRWEPDRKGRPTVKRRTARKKLQAAVKRMGMWLRTHRQVKLKKIMAQLKLKLRGYWNYYGIIGNSRSLSLYDYLVKGLLYKWLNRRSHKRSFTWDTFYRLIKRFEIPPPRIVEQTRQRLVGSCQTVWKIGQTIAVDLFGPHYRACACVSELI